MRWRDIVNSLFISALCLVLPACGAKEYNTQAPQQTAVTESTKENSTEENSTKDVAELPRPSKEEVFAMRELVLEGMTN